MNDLVRNHGLLKIIAALLLGFMLSACADRMEFVPTVSPTLSVSTPILPTHTPLPPTSMPTPTPTVTPTPSPTPEPAHPLSIQYLREQVYDAELVIEERLTPNGYYEKYIVSYQSEGYKNYALLTVPLGRMPDAGWPVIVFNHGYIPPWMYRTTELYMYHVHAFASQGYIVLRPDYRGHGSSEGEARGAYSVPDYTIDVLNALAAIKKYKDADADHIGMWGHSMGGYITLRAMVVDEDIRAGVIWGGVVSSYADLCEHWFRCEDADSRTNYVAGSDLLETYGLPEENPEFWSAASANTYLVDISGPVQLHHGTGDLVVPLILSQILYDELTALGAEAEFYQYEEDNHNIEGYYGTAILRSIYFFDAYLKDAE